MKGLRTVGFRRLAARSWFARIFRGAVGYRHNDYADIPQLFLPDRPWSAREQNRVFVLFGIMCGSMLGIGLVSISYFRVTVTTEFRSGLIKPAGKDLQTNTQHVER
jgi:hypothetical protein